MIRAKPKPKATQDALDELLQEVLNLDRRWLTDGRATPLLGSIPQLDSMAAVVILTELEGRFGIRIEDEDVSGEMFATFGALLDFVETYVAGGNSRFG